MKTFVATSAFSASAQSQLQLQLQLIISASCLPPLSRLLLSIFFVSSVVYLSVHLSSQQAIYLSHSFVRSLSQSQSLETKTDPSSSLSLANHLSLSLASCSCPKHFFTPQIQLQCLLIWPFAFGPTDRPPRTIHDTKKELELERERESQCFINNFVGQNQPLQVWPASRPAD